jgi:hypothetical protein
MIDVEFRSKIKGDVMWSAINSYGENVGMVNGAVLGPDYLKRVNLIVLLSRDELPSGPKVGRMIVRDHLGNRYRTPKETFKDANPGSPGAPSPQRTIATSEHPDGQ